MKAQIPGSVAFLQLQCLAELCESWRILSHLMKLMILAQKIKTAKSCQTNSSKAQRKLLHCEPLKRTRHVADTGATAGKQPTRGRKLLEISSEGPLTQEHSLSNSTSAMFPNMESGLSEEFTSTPLKHRPRKRYSNCFGRV